MKVLVETKNLWKNYKIGEREFSVLKNINIAIKERDFVVILGPSGSGKSTLLHLIGLLDKPTKGKVLFRGIDATKFNDEQLSKIRGLEIGFVFQSFNLVSRLNVLENVVLPTLFNKNKTIKDVKAKALSILKKMNMEHRLRNKVNELSGGERQRVAIARALINDPSLILADEPTGNLDTKTGKQIMDIFQKLNEEGKTIVIITHDLEIASYSKRQIHIRDGEIKGEVKKFIKKK